MKTIKITIIISSNQSYSTKIFIKRLLGLLVRIAFVPIMLNAMLFLVSCENSKLRIEGEGNYTTKDYTINDVYDIRVSTFAEVYIAKGETSLRIEAQKNILQVLNVTEKNSVLEIGKHNQFGNIKPIKIYISTNHLYAIQTAGKINVSSTDTFSSAFFKIDMTGTGNANLMVKTNNLSTYLSGEMDVNLSGEANIHNLFVSGEANILSYNLYSKKTAVDVSGLSEMEIQVEDKLEVDIRGKAAIYYKGNPEILQDISGSGFIISAN